MQLQFGNELQQQKLISFMKLVLEWNKVMDLTAITDEDEFIDKHLNDSLLPMKAINFIGKNVIDVGTGAGFPGIPLAILCPESNFTLVEPMQKRCKFLLEVVDKLELRNVKVLCSRVEDLDENYRDSFDICVTRAVAQLNILLELCIPFVKVNGLFVAYKGLKYDEEIIEAKNALNILNCSVENILKEQLPITKNERFNIIIKKREITDKKFPRNFSQIKRKPL